MSDIWLVTPKYFDGTAPNILYRKIFILIFSIPFKVDTNTGVFSVQRSYLILLGNKCDMEKDIAVTYETEKQLAEQTGLEFFQTSAKDNVSVLRVFERPVELIMSDPNNDNDKDRYKMLKCWRFTTQKLTTNGDKIIETP